LLLITHFAVLVTMAKGYLDSVIYSVSS